MNSIQSIRAELEAGISLPQCRQCGCMGNALKKLALVLPSLGTEDASALAESIFVFVNEMRAIRYSCLGCEHCYAAVAQNAFNSAFPSLGQAEDLRGEFQTRNEVWPPVVGEYFVLDKTFPVAVSTLSSAQLAEELGHCKQKGLAIAGKTETENIGIDKIIKNTISNPMLRYLIVSGIDTRGHLPGRTLLALAENGVDESGRVVGSPGKRPILRDTTALEIQAFREQVQVIDLIGCESLDEVCACIDELSERASAPCGCSECTAKTPISASTTPMITAMKPGKAVNMDNAGYFVFVPLADRGVINVEHYANDNTLLRVIEGTTARAIYHKIITSGWITELSHAAYLGKELAKAELSFEYGYIQDGA